MTNHIEIAVAPLEALAVEQAEVQARAYVARIEATLAAAEWNLETVAPRWVSGKSAWGSYAAMTAKRAAIEAVTADATPQFGEPGYVRNGPSFRKMSPKKIEIFVENCKEGAKASYRAYVRKLVGKIGEVTEATLVSTAGVWGSSSLKVITVEGARQVWNTQQIVNVSVLGKLFNQWPTRQAKKGW